jgi:hypothetical protein
MNSLESTMAVIGVTAIGPPGIITFDQWWGRKPASLCPEIHCGQKCHRSWSFCPRCGRGLRPIACEHSVPNKPNCLGFPEVTQHDPNIVIFYYQREGYLPLGLGFVKCFLCGRATTVAGRISHALNRWNHECVCSLDAPAPYPECPRCHSNRHVAFGGDFLHCYCGTCAVKWEADASQADKWKEAHSFRMPF